jgi:hypothetical protein
MERSVLLPDMSGIIGSMQASQQVGKAAALSDGFKNLSTTSP